MVSPKPVAARAPIEQPETAPPARPELEFFNGAGGFAAHGSEYVSLLESRQTTPLPWINVVANPNFGFQVSAEGGGYSWSGNSKENQITPWSNDPVGDAPGEILYLRDEETGAVWSPTALPIRGADDRYTARHGHGYSRFEHSSRGISLELLQYMPISDPVKIARLKIHNTTDRTRRLSVTAYVEWVLAASRSASATFIATESDAETKVLFARNPWNEETGDRVAFLDMAGRQTSWTGNRAEFIGRNGTPERPAALQQSAELSNKTGAGFDPCGAMQTHLDLKPNVVTEIVVFLGEAADKGAAQALAAKYRAVDLDAAFAEVTALWDGVLGALQVKTPDRAMDLLLNHWLLYQTLSCRIWGRTGFYQASGAYGFRDQLQDVHGAAALRTPIWRASICCAPPGGSSPKAMSSIGGCHPSGRGRAHPHFRRQRMAGLCRGPLCRGHRRPRDPGRDACLFSTGP